jgi:leucyl-tRNA synthetase
MYGQTCCFVGPKIKYGVFKVSEQEYFVCSERAARNMSFQKIFPKWGIYPQVVEFLGKDLVGTIINAPLSVHKDGVRILPMETVKDTKGTAVVTVSFKDLSRAASEEAGVNLEQCVPSDSPDDFATVTDLAKKAEYCKHHQDYLAYERNLTSL